MAVYFCIEQEKTLEGDKLYKRDKNKCKDSLFEKLIHNVCGKCFCSGSLLVMKEKTSL